MEMVGFVGLGRMGRPMASNMCRKGFRLVVHDINGEAVKELILNNQLLAMQSYGMGMSDVSQASAWAQEQEMLDFNIPDLR